MNTRHVFSLAVPCIALCSVVVADHPPLAKSPLTAEQAHDIQQKWATHIGQPLGTTNSVGMKLVLLPPGEFTMGRTEEQLDTILTMIKNDPKTKRNYGGQVVWSMLMMPAHRVRITKPFYMGATEVTVGQFRQSVEASGYKTEAEQGLDSGEPYKGDRPQSTWRKPMAWRKDYKQKDDEPVLHLCWNDCVAFCKWLSEKENSSPPLRGGDSATESRATIEYFMPTEAEWEYACRAGTTTPWHFGDFEDVDRVAHEFAYWSQGQQGKHEVPRSVGLGKPNAFGLYDMHGNLWEYVADWWHRMYYKESPLNDPTGPDTQDELNRLRRIIRGSSFDWDSWGGDSAYRMRIGQRSTQHPHMGFRVAMRIQGVQGVPPAVDPEEDRRSKKRDPGPGSNEVLTALRGGAIKHKPSKELTIDLGGGVKMEFVLIPAGSFLMGSDTDLKDERPVHRVVISKPFYMARYELTQSQWEAIMGKNERLEELRKDKADEAVGPNKAMNELSWTACQDFIGKLNVARRSAAASRDGVAGHFALPTEAQWEYACRAGSTTEFSFSDDAAALGEYAWFHGNMNWVGQPGFRGKLFYHDVGVKKPNTFGLYDIHGGVWEWCADWYDPDYYFTAPLVNPIGPEKGPFRVLRGGSWFRYAKYARSSYRKFFHPDGDGDATTAYITDFGCRLVINLEEDSTPTKSTPNKKGENQQLLGLAENLVKRTGSPVFGPGESGDWDDQGCGCFSLSKVGDQFMLWYNASGKRHKEWHIGLATSADGTEWKRSAANPIMRSGGMPCVLKIGDKFYMLFAACGGFMLAKSQDGMTWKQHGTGPVLRGVGESNDPCLKKFGDQFVLWYCGKVDGHYRILRATSPDCIYWELDPQPVIPLGGEGEFDSNGHAGPEVLKVDDTYFLFYLGNDKKRARWSAGVATSKDGKNWTKSSANPVLDIGGPDAWDGGSLMGLAVLWLDGRFHVWYAALAAGAKDKSEAEAGIRIGYAISKSDTSGSTHPAQAGERSKE
ncbi:MAG: SUMF1/EgtB/PvdO family nonheme iron enzyme [Planctomycetes bacterium]|nr:SUMF1/EgtB/PvdO family nonheme iron enzyme [Planctomycetota bacterium]